MTTRLTRIGNSLGVRVPKVVIQLAGLEGQELEMKVVDEGVLLAPVRRVRQGWKEAFQAMHAAGDDRLLLDDAPPNRFDQEEWEW